MLIGKTPADLRGHTCTSPSLSWWKIFRAYSRALQNMKALTILATSQLASTISKHYLMNSIKQSKAYYSYLFRMNLNFFLYIGVLRDNCLLNVKLQLSGENHPFRGNANKQYNKDVTVGLAEYECHAFLCPIGQQVFSLAV